MIKAVLRTIITLALLAWLLPTITFLHWSTIIFASIVLTFLFGVAKPILKLLFLPINIVTLGLFSALITVFLLWLSTYLVPGFIIESMILFGVALNQFWSLVVISFLIGFTQSIIKRFL